MTQSAGNFTNKGIKPGRRFGVDWSPSISVIVTEIVISETTAFKILNEDLEDQSVSMMDSPRLFSLEQKLCGIQIYEVNLAALSQDKIFIFKFVSEDLFWVRH